MNSIEALHQFGSQQSGKAKTSGSSQELGKDDFLGLLVAQLKNQDPLNPSDPTEFTGQLAQFSSLEQMNNISQGIEDLGGIKDEIGRMSSLSLIGRSVLAETDTLEFNGDSAEIGYSFPDTAESGEIRIKDGNGNTVDSILVNEPPQGNNFLAWDGTDSEGQPVPEGTYYLEAAGKDKDGRETEGSALAETLVTGADFSGSGSTLLTGNGKLELSDIVKVNNPT
ncbi:MAG: flagellar hook assembly protein FlgD [Desulfobacterales bacterium]